MKYVLSEFADSSADLKQKIREYTPIIFEHIYKIHHPPKGEISFYNEVKFCFKRYKSTNKSMTVNFITKAMNSTYIDSDEILDIVYDCCEKYKGYELKDVDVESAYDRITKTLPKLIAYVKSEAKESDLNEIIAIIES